MSKRDDSSQFEEREAEILPEHYLRANYDSLDRFISYWHQIDLIRGAAPERVLEIGVGNGFVADYLRQRGYDVVTLDINPALSVDVLGSITAVPLADDSFDVVCAFEVLEHLPTPLVADALSEMLRVTRDTAVVSVPNERITYPVQLPIPRIGVCRWLLDRCDPPDHVSAPEHLWEIGDGEVSVEDVREWIVEAGFSLVRDYRPFHNPRHHFFVLATL